MAETAKVLNPERIVVVPDRDAGCSLVDACPVDRLKEWKARNPGYTIVSYINTSIEVKAESDILCTSRNAVKIVNSIPPISPSCFCPILTWAIMSRADRSHQHENLAGRCIVHATSPREIIRRSRRAPFGAGRRASRMSF